MPSAAPQTLPRTDGKPRTDEPKAWNVVLLDDQDHTYEYVVRMVMELFGRSKEGAFLVAKAVDTDGRAICLTTHKEHAELKRDQILASGKDPLMARCQGSMSAIIEPAECGDDDEGRSPSD